MPSAYPVFVPLKITSPDPSTIRDKKERKAFEKKCKKKILQKLSELSKNTTNSEHNMVISEALRSRLGVLCLSETYEDILMWSHYAYYHKGFVIGIKTSNLITYLRKNFKDCDKIGFKKVNYTNLRNKENLNEFLSLKPFYEKNSLWEYEKEWRALLDIEIDWDKWKKVYLRNKEMKGIFSIPTECISKIIFGAMMEDSHIRAKCRHIRSQSGCQHITFERMRLHSTEYALVAERIPDDFWKKR